jgi:hypothetical protein
MAPAVYSQGTSHRKGGCMPIRRTDPASAMSQRDWVAVMALQGILANSDYVKGADLRRDSSVAAKKAYDLADAMIALSEAEQKPKAKA